MKSALNIEMNIARRMEATIFFKAIYNNSSIIIDDVLLPNDSEIAYWFFFIGIHNFTYD